MAIKTRVSMTLAEFCEEIRKAWLEGFNSHKNWPDQYADDGAWGYWENGLDYKLVHREVGGDAS